MCWCSSLNANPFSCSSVMLHCGWSFTAAYFDVVVDCIPLMQSWSWGHDGCSAVYRDRICIMLANRLTIMRATDTIIYVVIRLSLNPGLARVPLLFAIPNWDLDVYPNIKSDDGGIGVSQKGRGRMSTDVVGVWRYLVSESVPIFVPGQSRLVLRWKQGLQ